MMRHGDDMMSPQDRAPENRWGPQQTGTGPNNHKPAQPE
ncbi:hypothetical protein MKSMC1_29460 [Mycobacterium kansasii]|nr:hypothetical protein MKSMC1_29460 [Mycobacterium kansasii]